MKKSIIVIILLSMSSNLLAYQYNNETKKVTVKSKKTKTKTKFERFDFEGKINFIQRLKKRKAKVIINGKANNKNMIFSITLKDHKKLTYGTKIKGRCLKVKNNVRENCTYRFVKSN